MIDLSAYLIVGRENCRRPFDEVITAAVVNGFNCIQIRSKVASARQLINDLAVAARIIKHFGSHVTLLVNDRLDVALAARHAGIKVDGVHVGQSDIPVEVCRKYLGEKALIGYSARTTDGIDFAAIDYIGAGVLHPTATKLDAPDVLSHDDIRSLVKLCPVPVVIGGGVKLSDLKFLAQAGAHGFFVVSAVAGALYPDRAAHDFVHYWRRFRY